MVMEKFDKHLEKEALPGVPEQLGEDEELQQALGQIWDIAREHHLDPFPTHFQVAPSRIIYEVASYGIPGRLSHWTFGRAYQQQKTQYDYGLSKIYELVINSNPSQAFLLENNPPIANKFVMAHVLGHTDFFKNNVTFTSTRRDMPESVARSAARVRDYEEREGRESVEEFLDAVLSIEQYVDPYVTERPSRDEELQAWADQVDWSNRAKQPAIDEFADLFEIGDKRVYAVRELGRHALMMPPTPDSDILGFVRNHAPYLTTWQRDVVDIVRNESLYFYPQRRTKIMNEGWAAYWHKRIMREMAEQGNITEAENEEWWQMHSGVLQPNPRRLNPYYLGMKMYEYLEDYYNGTLDDDETAYLKEQGVETFPRYTGPLKDSPATEKLREVMALNDDQSFIRNYFNKIVADRTDMYIYEERRDGPLEEPYHVIAENGWEQIREMLVRSMDNNGVPRLFVKDGDYQSAGELYLHHEFDGRSLDQEYVEKTLPYIHTLWQRPVHLETVEAKTKRPLVYTCSNGRDVSRRAVDSQPTLV